MTRFEEPSSAARWDSPLITIPYLDPSLSILSESPDTPGEQRGCRDAEDIWTAITQGGLKPANMATAVVS